MCNGELVQRKAEKAEETKYENLLGEAHNKSRWLQVHFLHTNLSFNFQFKAFSIMILLFLHNVVLKKC